jgi:hypothetical protein
LRVQLQEPTDAVLLAEQIKMFQVPYKILCKVVNVELKVRNHAGRRRRRVFSSLFYRELVVVTLPLLFLYHGGAG